MGSLEFGPFSVELSHPGKAPFYATFICDPGTPRKCPLVKSHSYGKSPFLIYRNSTINGKFNSYVRHCQRVKHLPNIGIPIRCESRDHPTECRKKFVTLVPDKILGMETILKMQRFASNFGDDHGLSVFCCVCVQVSHN